jgi:hypothetical protein
MFGKIEKDLFTAEMKAKKSEGETSYAGGTGYA